MAVGECAELAVLVHLRIRQPEPKVVASDLLINIFPKEA
jgi:hypothetical protein